MNTTSTFEERKAHFISKWAEVFKTLRVTDWPMVLKMLEDLPEKIRRLLLYGKKGTGKTTYSLSLAPQSELITLTEGMFPDALLGKFLLRDGSTYWHNAAGSRAALHGTPLILDEMHKAGRELDSTFNALLNDKSVCCLNLDNGETITPAEGYRVIGTMNGTPDQLTDTVLDRFDVVLRCDTPHTGILRRMSPEMAAFTANKYANEPDSENYVPEITIRRNFAFENLKRQGVPDRLAADICYGEGQGKTVLMALVDAARNKS